MGDEQRMVTDEMSHQQFEKLVDAANSGDESALSELRQVLDQNPRIWQSVANLATHAQTMLINLISAGDHLLAESLSRQATEMSRTLVQPDASQVEQMAAERVVATWLQLQFLDIRCTNLDGGSRGWSGFWLRSRAQAQRTFEGAIRHLLNVQKMLGRPLSKPPVATAHAHAGSTKPQQAERKDATASRPPVEKSAPAAGMKNEASREPTKTVREPDDVDEKERTVPFVQGLRSMPG